MKQALLQRLRSAVGASHVLTEPQDMGGYVADWRGRYRGTPLCVVRPASVEEVASVVEACSAHGVAMVPQGGNTGLCGGAAPDVSGTQVVIALQRMNRVRSVDGGNQTLVAEAGCTLAQVQSAAEAAGCLFPLSLASEGSCQIGGNLSTNAGGVHVLRYGNMRDQVLGVEVVLADGRMWNGLRQLRKDNTGYDLKQLFVGAEGTLGVVTAVALKLQSPLRSRAVAWLSLPSVEVGVALLERLRDSFGARLVAFELVSETALSLVLKHMPGSKRPVAAGESWNALVELADSMPGVDLQAALEVAFPDLLERGVVTDGIVAQSQAQADTLWQLRENISEAQKVEGISIKHDISVPVSRIPEFLAEAEARLVAAFGQLRVVAFGHMGDGNLHYNLSRPGGLENEAFIAQTPLANRIVHDLVDELGGSISAEHGIGQLKREELCRYKSAVELELMRAIKKVFDPKGLLNPGKIL